MGVLSESTMLAVVFLSPSCFPGRVGRKLLVACRSWSHGTGSTSQPKVSYAPWISRISLIFPKKYET
jgi:hypothetical protein